MFSFVTRFRILHFFFNSCLICFFFFFLPCAILHLFSYIPFLALFFLHHFFFVFFKSPYMLFCPLLAFMYTSFIIFFICNVHVMLSILLFIVLLLFYALKLSAKCHFLTFPTHAFFSLFFQIL
jgi:hypothetical protein